MDQKECLKVVKKYLKFYGFYEPFYIRMFGSRDTPAIGEHWQDRDRQLKEIEQVLDKMYPEYKQILLERYRENLGFCAQADKYGFGRSQWHKYITSACLEFADKGEIMKLDEPVQKPSKRLSKTIKLIRRVNHAHNKDM